MIDNLKLKKSDDILVLNKPADVADFDALNYDSELKKEKYNIVFTFVFCLDELLTNLKAVISKDLIYPNGWFYFIYPKKGNKKYAQYIGRDDFFVPTEMTEDGYVFNSNLKFNKLRSFDDTFTLIGLKYVAKEKTASKPSQCVGDYIDKISDIKKYFTDNKEILSLYDKLTPGYQRDWARYVYSAQTDATREKRLIEMEDILKQGYKTKDLYRQGKK